MYYIGVDIGGTGIKSAIVSGDGKIIKKTSIKTGATRPYREVLTDLVESIKSLTAGLEYECVGIGCPGAVNTKGVVEYSNNLYWKDVPLAEFLSQRLDKPVYVSNDANVAALGEVMFGAAKDYSDAVLLTLGTGVGAGFVVNGKLMEGFNGMGAEGGHIVIRQDGALCTCGRKGCLEAYASATGLIRETINAMMIDKNSLMWNECGNDLNKVSGATSFEAAKKGDKSALTVVDEYTRALAEGALDFVNVFRCQAIILGGGVCAQGAFLTDRVQAYIDKYRYGGATSLPVKVVIATLGGDAGVIGAASLCMKK